MPVKACVGSPNQNTNKTSRITHNNQNTLDCSQSLIVVKPNAHLYIHHQVADRTEFGLFMVSLNIHVDVTDIQFATNFDHQGLDQTRGINNGHLFAEIIHLHGRKLFKLEKTLDTQEQTDITL